jgi:Tol biopolymer transport system component
VPESPRTDSVWSPDSLQVTYVDYNYDLLAYTLRIAEAATGLSREILSTGELEIFETIPTLLAWSPASDRLAIVIQGFGTQNSGRYWLGVVNADGTGLKILEKQNGLVSRLGFSANGQYLAATLYDSNEQSVLDGQTVIYSVPGYTRLDTLAHTWNFTWSPTGHQLAVIGSSGVDLIPNIGSPQRQNLAMDSCTEVRWNPGKTGP